MNMKVSVAVSDKLERQFEFQVIMFDDNSHRALSGQTKIVNGFFQFNMKFVVRKVSMGSAIP
jgi:hypothetical protein